MKPEDAVSKVGDGAVRRPWSKPAIIEAQLLRRSAKVTPTNGDSHVTTPVNTNLAGSS